jgi:flagellar hook-basal body complex protein FliE
MNSIGAINAVRGIGAVGGSGAVQLNSTTGISGPTSPVDGTDGGRAPGASFIDTLGKAFGELNGQLNAADASMADFASGGSADLHTVMLQMEEASIGLKAGVQVRDKLLEAYQELMRMQV